MIFYKLVIVQFRFSEKKENILTITSKGVAGISVSGGGWGQGRNHREQFQCTYLSI